MEVRMDENNDLMKSQHFNATNKISKLYRKTEKNEVFTIINNTCPKSGSTDMGYKRHDIGRDRQNRCKRTEI
jgi:hypothetical protein